LEGLVALLANAERRSKARDAVTPICLVSAARPGNARPHRVRASRFTSSIKFASAKLSERGLAAQAIEHNTDLLFGCVVLLIAAFCE